MTEAYITALMQAREDRRLREMSPAVRRHFETIERRMGLRQAMWGGNLSVLTEQTRARSAPVRRSLAVERVLAEMPVSIEPWDLIVGNSIRDDQVVRCVLPAFLLEEELGDCSLNFSHKCPDYETLLREGLGGILERLDRREAALKSADPAERRRRRDFAEAVRRECRAVIALAHRYAALALEQAETADPPRRAELLEIARVCRRVPEHPAGSLQEALQSIWLVNHALTHTMTYLSIGHVDRILEPYYLRDLEKGLPLERAQDLVDSFCLRVNDRAQIDPANYVVPDQSQLPGAPTQCRLDYNFGFVPSAGTDEADAINHWGQNILISGKRADGSDGTNPLTYLFLNAHEKFSMTSPVLTVRLHSRSPAELVERVAEVLKTGGGMPYINNDDIIIPAYEKIGVSHEDACEYANSNCWETLIQGKSNQEMIRGVNFLYLLELALNRGESVVYGPARRAEPRPDRSRPTALAPWCGPANPVVDGIDTGSPEGFQEFEELMSAWRLQLDHMLKHSTDYVEEELMKNGSHGRWGSNALLSALQQDCVERMTDLCHRGTRYDLWHIMGEAVSNAADAAAAIKQFVYDEKLLPLADLVEVLRNNWEGHEELRRRFLQEAPKFGNGDGLADHIAGEMVGYFLERVEHHARNREKIIYSPCIGTFSWIVNIGRRIGASADGRFSGEPIAANLSPAPGRDLSGPTAAVNSYLEVPTSPMAAGAPIDLRVSMNGLEGPEGTRRIAALISTFLELRGNMVTITITSAEELRRAMADPERYRGLRVRMGGWSAYYVLLSEESQKIHLRRVEHGMA